MTDNRELGVRVRDYLKTHRERKFTREELWSETFADDSAVLAVDADTQRRAIGRARESAYLVGGYITHAVAANRYTYSWTESSENAIDPMLHYTKIVLGQEDVLTAITKFVDEMRGQMTPDNRQDVQLIIRTAERAKKQAEITRDTLRDLVDVQISRRRDQRRHKSDDGEPAA